MAGHRIILDSGAVTALAHGEEAIRFAANKALKRHIPIVIPTVVIAESTTNGGPGDAAINRAIKIGTCVPCDLVIARNAAAIRYIDGAHTGV